MEELEKLFGDKLKDLITIYKCCASTEGAVVEHFSPKKLTNEQKLSIAKYIKPFAPHGDVLWCINWKALAPYEVHTPHIWSLLQENIDELPTKKLIRKRSLHKSYIAIMDSGDFEQETTEEIYKATGKIVPQFVIDRKLEEEDSIVIESVKKRALRLIFLAVEQDPTCIEELRLYIKKLEREIKPFKLKEKTTSNSTEELEY